MIIAKSIREMINLLEGYPLDIPLQDINGNRYSILGIVPHWIFPYNGPVMTIKSHDMNGLDGDNISRLLEILVGTLDQYPVITGRVRFGGPHYGQYGGFLSLSGFEDLPVINLKWEQSTLK